MRDFLRALNYTCFICVCELIVWDAKGLDAYRRSAEIILIFCCSLFFFLLLILPYWLKIFVLSSNFEPLFWGDYEVDKTWVLTAQGSSRHSVHVSASVFCFRRKTKREKLMSHKKMLLTVISQLEAVSEA